jgi:hypothetical protein
VSDPPITEAMAHERLSSRPDATTSVLREGDLVRWRERWAEVEDVAAFAGARTFVTLSFLEGGGFPLSVTTADLAGAEVWHRAGRLAAPQPEPTTPPQ